MPPITADDILKSVHDLKEIMQDEMKSMGERIAQARTLAEEVRASVVEFRREFVGPGSPLTKVQGDAATQRGGLFNGRMKLPYQRMITMSPNHPAVLPQDAERMRAIQDLNDALVIRFWHTAQRLGERATSDMILREIQKSSDWELFEAQVIDAGFARAANDIINPGAAPGSNLDFTLLSSQLIDLVRISAIVATQFPEIPLVRAKQEFPAHRGDVKSVLGGGLTTYAVPANDPASVGGFAQATMLIRPTMGQVAFDCIHNLGAIPYNDDMLEDSVIPFLPYVREQGAIGIARGRDAAIINGDDTATHMDSDVTAAYDIRKAWDGLRKLGENYEASIGAAATSIDVNTLMQKMGKFATRPRQLVLFLNVIDWLKICADPLMSYRASTVAGGIDRQTLAEGVVDRIYGVDVVVTEEIRRDLNTTGVYDATTTDNTIEVLARRDRFWRGQTRDLRVEQVRVPQALAGWLQVDSREDFQAIDKNDTDNVFPASSVAPVAIGVNVTS